MRCETHIPRVRDVTCQLLANVDCSCQKILEVPSRKRHY
jgi:hypothetical protein